MAVERERHQVEMETAWDIFSNELSEIKNQPKKNYFSNTQLGKIQNAFNTAYRAHKDQSRLSGGQYFSHLLATAQLILSVGMMDSTIKSPMLTTLICTAFLHDILEDTHEYGDPQQATSYNKWKKDARKSIKNDFSPQVAMFVLPLTQPEVGVMIDGSQIDKEKAMEMQLQELDEGPVESLLIKMVDRLHNLITFVPTPDRQTPKRKINETIDMFLPRFERARRRYPQATELLINAIKQQIVILCGNYNLDVPEKLLNPNKAKSAYS